MDSLAVGSSTSSDEDLSEFSFQSGPDIDCPTAGQLENTFVRLQEVELERNNFMSLTHRVELNRSILQHLLRSPAAIGQSESREESVTGSDLDVSDLEDQHNENKQRAFVSGPLPRQQQCAPGARMKRRPEPLRADHNLLTPDARSLSGVRFCPVSQVNSLPSHYSDSSQTASSRTTRRRPSSSPNRRLRFEDETEKEAESRYLERQKRRSGQRIQDVLVSKPDVAQYVNGRHKTGHVGESDYIVGQSREGVDLQLHPTSSVYNQDQSLYLISPSRPQICLRTEPIKETYIGVIRYSDEEETKVSLEDQRASNSREYRRANHKRHNGQTTPPSDLPINPYAPDQIVSISHSRVIAPFPPPTSTSLPSTISAVKGRPSETRTDKIDNHKKTKAKNKKCHKEERTSVADTPQSKLQAQGELKQETSMEESWQDPKINTSFSSSSVSTAETQSRPASKSDLKGKQTMRAKHDSVDSAFLEPVVGSRLSLRRLFSSVRLGRSRTNSLDRASSRSSTPAPDLVHAGSPSGSTKTYGLLKKTPSVQSLTMGSPFMKLRKSASIQNVSEQKKKDRSDNYKPAPQSGLQRYLSVEDVSCPSSVRSVGRILQVCSDGTLLLELSRPKSQTYGFIISRGKGRLDSGVYVEDMVDSSTEKLYAGLLAVGDEILEVNEEKVACLTLDQVTHLLTKSSTVTVRVLRQRKPSSR